MVRTGLGIFGAFIVGAALGASVALLYAPAKGEETRDNVARKIKEMETELERLRFSAMRRGVEAKDTLKERIADLEQQLEKLIKKYNIAGEKEAEAPAA